MKVPSTWPNSKLRRPTSTFAQTPEDRISKNQKDMIIDGLTPVTRSAAKKKVTFDGVLMPSPPTPPASSNVPYTRHPHIHIAAIDNSLAFPHEHPRGWRSYTYGWLYLPVSLIGQPFSEKTRNHFLPLLTSKAWWEETTYQLRKIFVVDEDFNWKMFQVCIAYVY